MKSKLVKVAFVAAIVMIGGINVFNAQKSEMLSDIGLANVEALADDENYWLKCAEHNCFVNLAFDCLYYVDGYLIGYCPNMKGE